MIKDISPSQELPASSKPPVMSPIFESVLDALTLSRFQPNFKHSSLRVCGDHPKRHQGLQPKSGTEKIIIIHHSSTSARTLEMLLIFEGVNWFQSNFQQSFLRSYVYNPEYCLGHQPQSETSLIVINPSNNCINVINFLAVFLMHSNSKDFN